MIPLEDGLHENALTIDDVLFNKPDMGDSLSREVTKSVVTDPDSHNKKKPDASYISRLHTLAGIATGPDGQAY